MTMKKASVRWQDGSHDPYGGQKQGDERAPFGTDGYKEIQTAQTYWDFMQQHAPFGFTEDGAVKEATSASPDVMSDEDVAGAEPFIRNEAITDEQVALMDEAFDLLSDKQKEVWQLCMRDGLSEREAGSALGISHIAVHKRLSSAKLTVQNFLRENGGSF
jgi:DNA-directed RNA polymerase specialized sigma24 family protein